MLSEEKEERERKQALSLYLTNAKNKSLYEIKEWIITGWFPADADLL
jgi:hypothetical protein